jgi:hypothetical protein
MKRGSAGIPEPYCRASRSLSFRRVMIRLDSFCSAHRLIAAKERRIAARPWEALSERHTRRVLAGVPRRRLATDQGNGTIPERTRPRSGPVVAGDRTIEWARTRLPVSRSGTGSRLRTETGFVALAAALAGHEVVAVDLEPCAFEFKGAPITYRRGDINELEFEPGSSIRCSTPPRSPKTSTTSSTRSSNGGLKPLIGGGTRPSAGLVTAASDVGSSRALPGLVTTDTRHTPESCPARSATEAILRARGLGR